MGQSQILPYLKGLSADYSIHVIACEKADVYEKRQRAIQNMMKGFDISWHKVNYRNTPPILGSFLLQKEIQGLAQKLIHDFSVNMIHSRSYPASIIAMKLGNKNGIPFIFDMRGFWPDERVEGKIWNLNNPIYSMLYRYFKRKEIELLNAAAHIITLTQASKKILESDFQIETEKISVIPCAADLNFFVPQKKEEREQYREKLGIMPDEKVLLYVGSVGSFYLTKEIFDFYKAKPKDVKAKLVFFSPQHSHQEIKNWAKIYGIDSSELIITFVVRENLPRYISIADLSVIFIKSSYSKLASSPTKHGELLAMHIPCVVNGNVGDMDMIVCERPTGYVIHHFEENEMKNAWNYILNTAFKSEDFNFIAQKYYSLNEGVKAYRRIYQNIISIQV